MRQQRQRHCSACAPVAVGERVYALELGVPDSDFRDGVDVVSLHKSEEVFQYIWNKFWRRSDIIGCRYISSADEDMICPQLPSERFIGHDPRMNVADPFRGEARRVLHSVEHSSQVVGDFFSGSIRLGPSRGSGQFLCS